MWASHSGASTYVMLYTTTVLGIIIMQTHNHKEVNIFAHAILCPLSLLIDLDSVVAGALDGFEVR